MKQKLTMTIIAILALSTMAFTFTSPSNPSEILNPDPLPPHINTKIVDKTKSNIEWKGYKVTGQHSGTIKLKNGELLYNHGKLVGGFFIMDMTTIKCTDLEGKAAGNLEGHLMSEDFFGVKKYPTAQFKITKVVSRGTPGDYKIIGDLTIKNITKQIKFQAHVDEDKSATAQLVIDRSDFNVKYGSGSFFDALGDKTIYDEFDLNIQLFTN